MTHRIFNPINRLAKRLRDPCGLDADTATSAANRAVAATKGEAMVEIDRLVAEMGAVLVRLRTHPTTWNDDDVVSLYDQSETLASLGGTFGLKALNQATGGLCRFLAETGGQSPETIQIYIQAILLLHRDDTNAEALLEGLKRVASKTEKSLAA